MGQLSRQSNDTPTASPDKSLLILDSATSGRARLVTTFRDLGFQVWAADGLAQALTLVAPCEPHFILVEITICGCHDLQLIQQLRTTWPASKTVVLTAQPSIASAVRMIRAGVAGYLVKPATAEQILASGEPESSQEDLSRATLTLDRAIWEYMREVVETAGSISEASRRLGVERRSLRRMLVKYAPVVAHGGT